MSQHLLAPRGISQFKVLGLVAIAGVLVAGSWYVYRLQQTETAQMKTSPGHEGTIRPRMARTPLKHAAPPEVKPVTMEITPVESNGHPSERPTLVDRVSALPAQAIEQVTPTRHTQARPPTTPKPLNRARAAHAKAPRLLFKREFKPLDEALGVRTLRPGWMIPFFVESLVNSAIPGSFKARVSQVVSASHDHRMPLIPSGAILVGTAQSGSLVPGSERLPMMGVTVDWPGIPKPLDLGSMPVTDQQGQIGMVDEIDRHLLFIAASVIARGAMEGASRIVEQEANQMGQAGEIPGSIAQGTERAADRQLQAMYDIRPTIRVHAGSRGYVFLTKTVPVPPWEFPR